MFYELNEIFMTTLILIYFDLDLKNQIETNTLNYAVTEIYT